MKNILLLAAFTMAGLCSFAQNDKVINDNNAQKRNVKGFHAIRIGGGIDLYLSQGEEEGGGGQRFLIGVSRPDPDGGREWRIEHLPEYGRFSLGHLGRQAYEGLCIREAAGRSEGFRGIGCIYPGLDQNGKAGH